MDESIVYPIFILINSKLSCYEIWFVLGNLFNQKNNIDLALIEFDGFFEYSVRVFPENEN